MDQSVRPDVPISTAIPFSLFFTLAQQWFLSDNAIEGVPSPISLAYPIPGSNPPQTNKLCLDVTDGSTMNGVHMQVWTCVAGNTNQKFIINNVTGSIMWAGHPKCLDLTNGSGANGNIVSFVLVISANVVVDHRTLDVRYKCGTVRIMMKTRFVIRHAWLVWLVGLTCGLFYH
jgi:hypothetical protein